MRLKPIRPRQRGFSLIEVLIALLVLALGLLGLALLQTMNLRFTKSAEQRTIATNLAYELIDKMRAQRLLASRYTALTRDTFLGVDPRSDACRQLVSSTVMTPDVNVGRWRCQVRAALPEATGDVALGAGGVVTVTIQWEDSFWATGNTATAFEVRSQL